MQYRYDDYKNKLLVLAWYLLMVLFEFYFRFVRCVPFSLFALIHIKLHPFKENSLHHHHHHHYCCYGLIQRVHVCLCVSVYSNNDHLLKLQYMKYVFLGQYYVIATVPNAPIVLPTGHVLLMMDNFLAVHAMKMCHFGLAAMIDVFGVDSIFRGSVCMLTQLQAVIH